MRKHVMIPALLALSVGLAACSHDPNANLESARTNFSALQSDPQSSKVAALETKDAQDWLNKADKAYMDREDQKKVDQLAYLTNQRVEVAKQTIALRTAEGELKNASAQRAQAKLDARDAQIAKLQDSLNAKQTDRGTLVTFGDVQSTDEVIALLAETGFEGFLLDDHVPKMDGDSDWNHRGRAHAIGYMQGLLRMLEFTQKR